MKNLVLVILTLVFIQSVTAQKLMRSKIKEVTVYTRQALVEREVKSTVKEGYQQLILTGIPNNVNKNTIEVKGKGDFIILGLKHQQNLLSEETYPEELQDLKNQLEQAEEQLVLIQNDIRVLKLEEEMLIKNQKIGGTQHVLTVNELESMANFMRKRFSEIATRKIDLGDKEKSKKKEIKKLKEAFEKQTAFYSKHSSEIVLDIDASTTSSAVFSLRYIVRNAGWYPTYDIRAESESQTVDLAYKANVYQTTGELWDNVKLSLSTGNPSAGNTKPVLNSWYLNFYEPRPMMMTARSNMRMDKAASSYKDEEVFESEDIVGGVSDFVEVEEGGVNTTYSIDKTYVIPSDGQVVAIEIQKSSPSVAFSYAAVPKYSSSAYLVGKLIDWESQDQLSGNMSIYLDGSYVGESYLNTRTEEKNITVSLGRDERIIVKRDQLKDYTSRSFFGGKKKERFGYKIIVKNTRSKTITITVEDHIPVSQNSEIAVELLDRSPGAILDEEKGIIKWKLELPSGEEKQLTLGYEVVYPKDKQIGGL